MGIDPDPLGASPSDRMRGIISAPFAAGILRNLLELIEGDEVRLTDFTNNVFRDSGMISLKWEERKKG